MAKSLKINYLVSSNNSNYSAGYILCLNCLIHNCIHTRKFCGIHTSLSGSNVLQILGLRINYCR